MKATTPLIQLCINSSRPLLIGVDYFGRLPLPVCVSAFNSAPFVDKLAAALVVACGGFDRRWSAIELLFGLLYLLIPWDIRDVVDSFDQCVLLPACDV